VKLKHTNSIFEVTVDDKICFSTNKVCNVQNTLSMQVSNLQKVNLPVGNTFGFTAATPENPDSFEIFKFILSSATGQGQTYQGSTQQQQEKQEPIANQNQPPVIRDTGNPVIDAGIGAQFVDLQGRIQLQNKATNTIIQDLKAQAGKSDARHTEIMQKLASKEQVAALDARLQRIESLLQNIQRDLEGKDYSSRFNQLQDTLRSSHLSLTENLQTHFLSGKSLHSRLYRTA
jgi:mannose-binding lectin 1